MMPWISLCDGLTAWTCVLHSTINAYMTTMLSCFVIDFFFLSHKDTAASALQGYCNFVPLRCCGAAGNAM